MVVTKLELIRLYKNINNGIYQKIKNCKSIYIISIQIFILWYGRYKRYDINYRWWHMKGCARSAATRCHFKFCFIVNIF